MDLLAAYIGYGILGLIAGAVIFRVIEMCVGKTRLLRCVIFGHSYRYREWERRDEETGNIITYSQGWCRHCGEEASSEPLVWT